MKKEMVGKLFVLIFISMFFVALVANGVIAQEGETPATQPTPTNQLDLKKAVNFIIGDWNSLNVDVETVGLIGKFLILLLAFLFISAIITELPIFTGKPFMAWLASAIIVIIGSKFIPADFLIGLFLPSSAALLSLSVVLQLFIIFEINRRIFKNSYYWSWLTWSLWGFFLIGLIFYFSGWEVLGIRGWLGWGIPTFKLSRALMITYAAIALLAWAGVWTKLQLWIAKKTVGAKLKDTLTALEIGAAYVLLRRIEEYEAKIDAMAGSTDATVVAQRGTLLNEVANMKAQLKKDYLK